MSHYSQEPGVFELNFQEAKISFLLLKIYNKPLELVLSWLRLRSQGVDSGEIIKKRNFGANICIFLVK